ncbi:MAG: hypothetical protein NWF07_14510 [Candidatus Bathyarchaeota archaeon]|nr:hypothetical protein [Candidatus Bathyarchaeota archaeon]
MVDLSPNTLELIEDINRLGVSCEEVETLERCETITNLIIDEVFTMFNDPKLVEDLKWLQMEHRTPNMHRWRNIVELTESMFSEVGGAERVKGYHMLEQPCKDVTDEELELIEDKETSDTIHKIKHIHEATLKRMSYLVEKCYYK